MKPSILTPVERAIVCARAMSANCKEIASALGMSVKSVQIYQKQAWRKLRVSGVAQATRIALGWMGLLCAVALCGCAVSKNQGAELIAKGSTQSGSVQSSSSIAPGHIVVLAWDNEPQPMSMPWVTGLEASNDLTNWQEVYRMDYGTGGPVRVTLTNRPAIEFYRAYNRLR